MKKFSIIVYLIVSLSLLFSCVPNDETMIEEQTLTVGCQEISEYFIEGFSSNNSVFARQDSSKYWAISLIHGYETYSIDQYGRILLNQTVVDEVSTELDEATGNKSYIFILHNDLYWSDGINITAKDYVFSLLMQASVDWKDLGSTSTLGDKLIGYDTYRSKESSEAEIFEGVKLIDEYTFSLTLDSEYTPLFYETYYLVLKPLPYHRLAPLDAEIQSDSSGSWIEEGGFSLLDQAASVSGYLYFPDVTSGPYTFISYVNNVVTLKINNQFKGNFEGKKPNIDNIIIKEISVVSNVDLVISGEIDYITQVLERSMIEEVNQSSTAAANSYARNGHGILAMAAHFGPTADYRVRQAITHVINKQIYYDFYSDGIDNIVHSEYGKEQWMTIESKQWLEDHINKYTLDQRIANDILDTTQWIYESDGVTPFDELKARDYSEYYRHNQLGETLEINHLVPYSGAVLTEIYNALNNSFQRVGINYSLTHSEYSEVLNHYYYSYNLAPEEKKYHLFNSSINFTLEYDPYLSWHSDFIGTYLNPNQLIDSVINPNAPLEDGEKTLDELSVLMREVEPGDYDTYLTLWRQYQLRWNKLTPNIPTYSYHYYNVFDSNLKGVKASAFNDWTSFIYDMYFEESIDQ